MFIDDFVTKRIRARMQELTLRQAIELCQIPDQLNELGISRALSMIVIGQRKNALLLSAITLSRKRVAIGASHKMP